jgi:predicted permease
MIHYLLRIALLLAPREFRSYYGEQIAAGECDMHLNDVLDLAVTGIRMRLDDFARGVSYAVRRLIKAPVFVAIVALTFALGIGANVAVFSVLNTVVLKPLPYNNSAMLVSVRAADSRRMSPPALSLPDIDDLRAQSHALTEIAGVTADEVTLLRGGRPISLGGLAVMPEYFDLLGIRPQLGRALTVADSRPGVNNYVISDATWRADFGADPSIIDRAVTFDGRTGRIVGVLAPGQLLVNPRDGSIEPQDYLGALPETLPPRARGARYLSAIARIAPSSSLTEVNAELALVSARLQKLYPRYDSTFSFSVQSLRTTVLGGAAPIVWTVFAAVIGILLIACANVGNMLSARWSVRDREFALRRSLGATSWSVAQLMLIETGILALAGALLGIGLAYAALRGIGGYALATLPRGSAVSIDAATLLYALAIVVVTTLLAALAPFMSLNATDLNSMLKAAGRGGDASARHRSRAALVVLEIALALALVIVSGLMVRSFIELARTPLGIRPSGVVVSDIVSLPDARFPTLQSRAAAQQQLLGRLRALPGVDAAALSVAYPLSDISLNFDTSVLGKNYPQGTEPSAAGNDVSAGYFRALGVALIAGRDISDDDTARAPAVVVVNQAFARTILAGRDPLRAKIRIAGWNGTIAHWASVVGVVADTRLTLAEAPVPQYFVPIAQAPPIFFSAVVHATGLTAATLGRQIQDAFASELPTVAPPQTFTVEDRVALRTARVRMTATLLGLLATVALLIALAGIFGVVSFSVTQRSREFGVRIALGAGTSAILGDVLRRTLATTAIGVASGLAIAALAARAITSQLNSVSPFDPATFATVVVLIFLCAALASLQPALRATRVQPVDALRYE